MRKQPPIMSKERTVYWPAEFASVVNQLTAKNSHLPEPEPSVYPFNTGAIVFAATVGLKHQRKRAVGADVKEIVTSTFASHGLEPYIFLIAMLGIRDPDIDLLRPENEERMVKEFEQYAAGGLEYLHAEFERSPTSTGELMVERLILSGEADEGNVFALPDL